MNVKYFDEPVKDSPFTVTAWNPAQVLVNCIAPGVVGRQSSFHGWPEFFPLRFHLFVFCII